MDCCWVPYKLVNALTINLWGADCVLHAAVAALVRLAADRTPAVLTERVVVVAVGRSVRQVTAAPSFLKHTMEGDCCSSVADSGESDRFCDRISKLLQACAWELC